MADTIHLDIDAIIQKKLAANEEKYPVEKAFGTSKMYSEH